MARSIVESMGAYFEPTTEGPCDLCGGADNVYRNGPSDPLGAEAFAEACMKGGNDEQMLRGYVLSCVSCLVERSFAAGCNYIVWQIEQNMGRGGPNGFGEDLS